VEELYSAALQGQRLSSASGDDALQLSFWRVGSKVEQIEQLGLMQKSFGSR
jgi:hypothetical protein